MPQHSLQLIKLLEENAAVQVGQLEEILAKIEPGHRARHLLEQAITDARERQRAMDAAWKAALEILANSQR